MPPLHRQSPFSAAWLAAALAFGAALPAQATTILQDQRSGIFQVQFYAPMAQSFTAVDPGLESIGFWISAINAHFPRVNLGVRLHQGDGVGGAVLATRDALPPPPPGFAGSYYDWDFHGVSLTPGQVYTAELFTTNPYWGVDVAFADIADPYSGGRAYSQGQSGVEFVGVRHQADLRFRVIGTPVPEPSTALTLAMGLAGLAVLGRRRSRAK